ncbi:FAST kinase domain-containing protein 5, mitochondrial-like isoform X2 [Gigantopelta aegis]|uniref:FAST kinase domain-containing protein 5, mitochondrial-like isoform X2 n=1 Tax=Gigantopelta aegis TaxID=1735272 RepID=UPI001B88BFF6|nr:FAST kinase domain-containing protein 5, mitochondrial-like isoform X2 [Gigantopelta aegis]
MQRCTSTSRGLLQFFRPVDVHMWRRGLILHLHTCKCVNRQQLGQKIQVKYLPFVQKPSSVISVSHLQNSGSTGSHRSGRVDSLQIQTRGFTSVSLKENLLRSVKKRRQDPIKVAQILFKEIRERHQGQGSLGQGHVSGQGHVPGQGGAVSKINVAELFEAPDSSSDLNRSNLVVPSTQVDVFETMSSTSLYKMLQNIHLRQNKKIHGYNKTISVIRNILSKRIETDGLTMSLDVADVLFVMGANCRQFVSAMFDYVTVKFDDLEMTSDLITRLMFYVFLHGSAPPLLYPKVEEFLSDHVRDFHIGDISVICLGFFRSNRRIESTVLLEKMASRLLTDIERVGQHGIVNILKAFRHSGYNNITFLENLADTLISKNILENCSNINLLMHIVSTYASLSVFHSDLLEVILKHFVNIVCQTDKSPASEVRSKDLAKFIWAYGVFVFEPVKHRDSYLKLVVVYRDRVTREDLVYPESLADMLQGLMYLQIFPQDLIAKMFNMQTAVALRDDEVMRKAIQLLMIHNAVIIECPLYSGPTLKQSFIDTLSNIDEVKKSLDFEFSMRRGLAKVRNTLKEMFGEDCVHCHFILSQFRSADIELRFNRDKEAVKFEPEEFNSNWLTENKTDIRVAVEVAGLNQFCTKSSRMKGNYDTKLRQLRLLGYHVVLITPHQMDNFRKMTSEERKQFLTQCLRDVWNQS